MRKKLVGFIVVTMFLGLAPSLYAGGIINKQNFSAECIRTLNRNAAYDAADVTVYNPAGVMRMENGLYLKMDTTYLNKDYSNHLPSSPAVFNLGSLDSNEPSIIPSVIALYKKDNWAGFFAITIPGGGGKVKYEDGNARTAVLVANFAAYLGASPLTANQFLKVDSVYAGYTLGGAYKIIDSLSLAGGIRYVDAYQKFSGYAIGPLNSVNVDIKRTAEGWNYFLGLNYAPINDLNIGLLYLANSPLNFKSKTKDSSPGAVVSKAVGWVNGTHEREDLPGYLAFGVSYFIIPNKLRIESNLTYYLEKSAKLEGERFKDAGNSYDVGVALEYIFNPQWKMSAGYVRTDIRGMKPDNLLTEVPELDANTFGLGVVWSPLERLSMTVGAMKVWYESEKKKITNGRGPAGTELEKKIWGLSLGIQYRFF